MSQTPALTVLAKRDLAHVAWLHPPIAWQHNGIHNRRYLPFKRMEDLEELPTYHRAEPRTDLADQLQRAVVAVAGHQQ